VAPASETQQLESLERLKSGHDRIVSELRKVIVGQDRVVEELLTALFANGHCLLVGVPGLAKTLLVSSLARVLDLKFSRIQFTPDLMPSDITGTEILEENRSSGQREFRFIRGPVFANLILADEINRTPPKTQAALLQAMQEHEVTAGGQTMPLEPPFFVLATQNPIELEGTYPLPEAQLDRFMLHIHVDYPTAAEEERIVTETTGSAVPALDRVFGARELIEFQGLIRRVPVADFVVRYAVRLARSSRPEEGSPDFVRQWVSWGAGLRAGQSLVLGAKARALLAGRFHVTPDDIRALVHPTLRHRILLGYRAEADGVSVDAVIDRLLDHVK